MHSRYAALQMLCVCAFAQDSASLSVQMLKVLYEVENGEDDNPRTETIIQCN